MNNETYNISHGIDRSITEFIKPITIFGKNFGIKILSVYEFLKCDLSSRNLIDKLSTQGFDKNLCKEVCERACIISLCLYGKNNERIFSDGLSVLMGLTPEELRKIYNTYNNISKNICKTNISSSKNRYYT